jgi:hypothetical protein
MKSFQVQISTWLTIAFFSIIPTSCSDEGEAQPKGSGIISMEFTAYNGYEIATMFVSDFVLDKNQYELLIGAKTIEALKNNDNSLSFIVPGDLPTGNYDINSSFASNAIRLTVTSPALIADPDTYVEEFIGDLDADIENYLTISAETNAPQKLLASKAKLEKALSDLKSLGAEDKQVAAQVLKANSKFFEQADLAIQEFLTVENEITNGRANRSNELLDGECSTVNCTYKYTLLKIVGLVVLSANPATIAVVGIDIVLSILTEKRSILLSSLIVVIKKGLEITLFAPVTLYALIIDQAAGVTTGLRKSASEINILNGEVFTITPQVEFRTLSASDVSSSNTFLKNIASAVEKAKIFYTNTLGSPEGPFPGYAAKKEIREIKSLDEYNVKVLNNSLVTVSEPQGTNKQFTVMFNSASEEKQTFTIEITYNDGAEESTEALDAILRPQRQPAAIVIADGNAQEGSAGTHLDKTLKVKVMDANNSILKNAEVEWSVVLGGGELTASKTMTNEQGIAEVGWTLGADPETQEVEVRVRKWDGTLVSGAPLKFTAAALKDNYIKLSNGVYIYFEVAGGCDISPDDGGPETDNPSDFYYDSAPGSDNKYISVFFSDHGYTTQPAEGTYGSSSLGKIGVSFAHPHFSATEHYNLDGSFTLAKNAETNKTIFEFQGTRTHCPYDEELEIKVCTNYETISGKVSIPCSK